MNNDAVMISTLQILLYRLPVFITWITGIILALVYWKRHPKVSLVALMAFIGFIFLSIIAAVYSALFPVIMSKYKLSMMMYNTVFNLFISLLNMGLSALLLVAVFGWRKTKVDAAH